MIVYIVTLQVIRGEDETVGVDFKLADAIKRTEQYTEKDGRWIAIEVWNCEKQWTVDYYLLHLESKQWYIRTENEPKWEKINAPS